MTTDQENREENKVQVNSVLKETISFAMDNGIEGCDLILNSGNSLSVSVQNQNIDSYKASGYKTLGIRVIKDDRVGLSYTEDMDEASRKKMVLKAIENSEFSKVVLHEKILDAPRAKEATPESNTDISQTRPDQLIDLCKKLESEVKKKGANVSGVPYNGVSESFSTHSYMNSHDLFKQDENYEVSCYTSALIKTKEKNSLYYEGAIAKNLKQLDYLKCIDESYKHAHAWLSATPLKSGKYSVVFDINTLHSLFGAFSGIFSSKSRMEKSNPMASKLGEQIFCKSLSIIDSPRYKDAFYKSYFDSEGAQAEEITLIKNGVLKEFYHNSMTANHFEEKNNFRASRSPRGPLGIAGTNILISRDNDQSSSIGMQPTSGKYLFIKSIQGLHSGLNFMSGDFSFGASGYYMNENEIIHPVNEITVAGNFYKLFNEIEAIGENLESSTSYDFFAPTMRFSELTVAG